jgi:hypothetical protein
MDSNDEEDLCMVLDAVELRKKALVIANVSAIKTCRDPMCTYPYTH